MVAMEVLLAQITGLQQIDVERWIGNDWVHADGDAGQYEFAEIDIARVRLIRELRDDLQVSEEALGVILLLLDQLYDVRRLLISLRSSD